MSKIAKDMIRPLRSMQSFVAALVYTFTLEIIFPIINVLVYDPGVIKQVLLPTSANEYVIGVFMVPLMGHITSRGFEKCKTGTN